MLGPIALATLLLAGPVPAAVLDGYDLARPARRLELPAALREVSGLAVTPDGKLLSHDDESAVVREVDPATGAIVRSIALLREGKHGRAGKPLPGDFEGIAIAGGTLYLTTSDGILIEAPLPTGAAGDAPVTARVTDTGLGSLCEIEGLAADPSDGSLLFACKKPLRKDLKPFVTLLRWSLARRAPSGQVRIPLARLAGPLGEDGFRPSDLCRDAATGHLLIVASHQRALAELMADGTVVAVRRLAKGHPQAEGLALLPDGTLAVADEGGRGTGLLTLYRKVGR